MTGTTGRLAVMGTMGLALCGAAALGQPPRPPADPGDLIREAKDRQKIADQRAQATAMTAVRDAEALSRTNPVGAAQLLRGAMIDIDQALAVSPDTRKNLTAMLQAKMKQIQARGGPLGPAATPAPRVDRQAAFKSYEAEVKAVQEGVDLVARFQAAGRTEEANRVIRNLARDYPNNPSVIFLTQKDNARTQVEDARLMAKLQSERVNEAFKAVDRSSIPAGRDVEFPPDFRERTKNRTNTVQMSAKEEAIIKSLGTLIEVNYSNQTLQEALQDLSTRLGQPLAIDNKSLADLGIDLTKPVTVQGKGIPARTVLRQVLGAAGLTYVVKDEVIQVVTVEKARDMLVSKAYYLGDLVAGVGPFNGVNWGPYVDLQQTMANAQLIIDAIQSGVDPLCWKEKGGPCTITFHYPSMSLVVRASAEVHSVIGSKFGGGR